MNEREFLRHLNDFFPCDEEDSVFEKRLLKYSELLVQKETEKGRKLDYDKMINSIVEKYPYRGFPTFAEIVKHIAFEPIKHEKFQWGRKYIVNKNGHLYEFEEVPPWWNCPHKLSDFEDVRLVE